MNKCLSCDARCCAKAGAVLVTDQDILRLSEYFGISYFKDLYTHEAYDKVDGFIQYLNKKDIDNEYSDCIYKGMAEMNGQKFIGCTVYEARPEVCRLYSNTRCKEEFC